MTPQTLLIIFTILILVWGLILSYRLDRQKEKNKHLEGVVREMNEAYNISLVEFSKFVNENGLIENYCEYLKDGKDDSNRH